jgi:probable rRNA maturation factor
VSDCGVVVEVSNRQRRLKTGSAWVRRLVEQACAAIGIDEAEISVVLLSDAAMAQVNEEWLEHEGPTDVITFLLSEATEEIEAWPGGLTGDIVVSTETACRVAAELGWPAENELAYYIVHGLLHLAGYDDTTALPRAAMRREERRVMKAIGLPSPPRRPASALRQPSPKTC